MYANARAKIDSGSNGLRRAGASDAIAATNATASVPMMTRRSVLRLDF
jgi:hypothetical protein